MGRVAHWLLQLVDTITARLCGEKPTTRLTGTASNPRESWRPNSAETPARTLVDALKIAMNAGVPLEELVQHGSNSARCSADGIDFQFVLTPATDFEHDTYASYYDLDTEADLDRVEVLLRDLQTVGGRFCISISDDILRNDEQSIGVVAHEVHELCALSETFNQNGGRMTLRLLNSLIHNVYGTLHCAAWDYADELVRKHRA